MKILQVNKFYSPWIGGVEKIVQEIAEGLKDKVNMQVLVCQPKGRTKTENINGVKIIKAGSFGRYFSMPISFSFFKYFNKLSKSSDIIHLHMPFPLGDLACLLSRYKGKVVIWWHSDIVKQKKLMILYKPLMNWMLKRADLIFVATKWHIKGSKYLGNFKAKCKVIPYGIDIEKYKISDKNNILSDKLNSKENKKILFVGRLVYYKGVNVLVDAFKTLNSCELFIVGQGELEGVLKENVKSFEINDKVHFLGPLNDEDLKFAFADCDVFVLPSIENSEAFGLVQLEAMAYGKPVINTSLPTGVPYVSLNGVTGLTVKPGDVGQLKSAIQRLVDDDELRKKMGKISINRVKNVFNIDRMMENIYYEYKNLLKGRN